MRNYFVVIYLKGNGRHLNHICSEFYSTFCLNNKHGEHKFKMTLRLSTAHQVFWHNQRKFHDNNIFAGFPEVFGFVK